MMIYGGKFQTIYMLDIVYADVSVARDIMTSFQLPRLPMKRVLRRMSVGRVVMD